MKHLSLVVGLLLGCGASGGAQVGEPCSLEAPCTGGAVCDFTDPAGPVCVDADGDLDGDGLPNDRDFCAHQAGGAFDEDRDGIGDDCDRCPIAPPPAAPDPDGDLVDSPCDPDPSVAGDQIAVFAGFGEAALPAGFTASAGWQFVAGEAVVTPGDPVTTEVMTTSLPLISQQVAVFGQYRIDGVDPQATQNSPA